MTTHLLEKARAGRHSALASLKTRLAGDTNVVSLFEEETARRRAAVPEFHSVRSQSAAMQPAPVLVLTDKVAA